MKVQRKWPLKLGNNCNPYTGDPIQWNAARHCPHLFTGHLLLTSHKNTDLLTKLPKIEWWCGIFSSRAACYHLLNYEKEFRCNPSGIYGHDSHYCEPSTNKADCAHLSLFFCQWPTWMSELGACDMVMVVIYCRKLHTPKLFFPVHKWK